MIIQLLQLYYPWMYSILIILISGLWTLHSGLCMQVLTDVLILFPGMTSNLLHGVAASGLKPGGWRKKKKRKRKRKVTRLGGYLETGDWRLETY